MKISYLFLFLILGSSLTAQEEVTKPFAKSSNKYYIGASVSPAFVALLNGQSLEPEWKLAYKHRLSPKNHYVRLSYSYLGQRMNNYYLDGFWNYNFDQRVTSALNDSMDWVSGAYKNVSNNQILKLGYEYQFKVGQKRNLSLNMGGDFLVGFQGGKVFYANDTITYRDETIDGWVYRNTVSIVGGPPEVISKAQVYYGFSPFIALGIPLKKRFDLTFEMAFDCNARLASLPPVGPSIDVSYRPSLMLSYRFDEAVSRNGSRDKGTKR